MVFLVCRTVYWEFGHVLRQHWNIQGCLYQTWKTQVSSFMFPRIYFLIIYTGKKSEVLSTCWCTFWECGNGGCIMMWLKAIVLMNTLHIASCGWSSTLSFLHSPHPIGSARVSLEGVLCKACVLFVCYFALLCFPTRNNKDNMGKRYHLPRNHWTSLISLGKWRPFRAFCLFFFFVFFLFFLPLIYPNFKRLKNTLKIKKKKERVLY